MTELLVIRRPSPALLSVVLPAYNEAASLPTVVSQIATALAPRAERLELIVVDDGSRDATAQVVLGLRAAGWPLRLIRLSRNFGKEAALTAGLDAAEGDVVLCMDGDGQHPLATALQMLDGWQAGDDVVYGVQTGRRASQPWLRRAFTSLFYRLMRSGARFDLPPDAGDFRLLDRRAVLALRQLPERARYMKGLFAWVGFRTHGVTFEPVARVAGESRFCFMQLAGLALTGLTAFSKAPLRAVSVLGVLVSGLSVLFGLWIVAEKLLMGNPVSGFATLAASITFLAGVQLLCLGIIAEYLGQVFDEVKRRPLYLADEVTPPLP